MSKILFFIVVGIIFFSCKKDNLKNSIVDCEVKYYENTEAFDFAPHDSMVWYAENGWNVNNPEVDYDSGVAILSIKVNPNNPYELIYSKTTTVSISTLGMYYYNFCNNQHLLIKEGGSLFTWTSKDIVFYSSYPNRYLLYKMNSDGSNKVFIDSLSTPAITMDGSPNGELLMITRKELGKMFFTILTEGGEEVLNVESSGAFIGWFDNLHMLIQYDNEVYKKNIYTEEEEFFLAGKYDYYDQKTEQFISQKVVNNFESWQILDKNGVFSNETESHFRSGFYLHKPQFLDKNRIISRYLSREYAPTLNGMLIRNKAIIMNLDGSNARRVTPLEE